MINNITFFGDLYFQSSGHPWWLKKHRNDQINMKTCPLDEFSLTLPTLWAASPLIFLDKSGRERWLCEQLQNSLMCHSSKKMDESVQFSSGQTSFSLMCMITRKNCWLFLRLCYVTMVTALLSYKVFAKAMKFTLRKVIIGNISSLT